MKFFTNTNPDKPEPKQIFYHEARNFKNTKKNIFLFRAFACPVGLKDRTGVISSFRDYF